jgi:adenosylmethionine-8-amino-7-oxononanoate aminotransferase/biotin synthase
MSSIDVVALATQVKNGYLITEQEALALASTTEKAVLYDSANSIREHFCGSVMDLCSITNAKSGKCSENCAWCSQSAWHKSKIEIYAMVEHQRAVSEAVANAKQGVLRHSLVASGKRVTLEEVDQFISIYRDIRSKCKISLCASMGLLTREALERLKAAGVTKYHCNLETAPSFFSKVCSTHSIEEKIQTIRDAQSVGLEVCSGGIIGMGETMAQRVELAFLLRAIGIVSIPINILNPIAGTTLENASPLNEEEVLTTIALFRFINPQAYLRFAGGRLLIRAYQTRALRAGINASIVGDMLTTVGSGVEDDLRDFSASGFTFEKLEN